MSDGTIRDAERRWRETGDAESAAVYLRALERAGLLPDQVPVEAPTNAPPIEVECGRDRAVIAIPGVGRILVHHQTPVAVVLSGLSGPDADAWAPEAAHSRSSERAIREWFADQRRDITMAEEVEPARLVDLLRLVPLSEFWPTCDGCFEKRPRVTRQRDGLDMCTSCAAAAAMPAPVAAPPRGPKLPERGDCS